MSKYGYGMVNEGAEFVEGVAVGLYHLARILFVVLILAAILGGLSYVLATIVNFPP